LRIATGSHGQLAGLERRKLELEMLGSAVQKGLDQQQKEQEESKKKKSSKQERSKQAKEGMFEKEGEPVLKKRKVDTEDTVVSTAN
jgi:hypothetical protein